jgi:PAS domain S-box-containing protein
MGANSDRLWNVRSRVGVGGARAAVIALLWFAAFGAAYYLAYRDGMSFSQVTASPFWFPDSILLCALLSSRPRYWSFFVLLTLPLRLLCPFAAELPLWYLLGTFAIDSGKGLLAAFVLRRVVETPARPQTVRDLAVFGAVVVFAVPFVFAFAGAAVRARLGYPFWPSWEQWFLGDAVAQLVVTPFILYWILGLPQRNWALARQRAGEAGLLVAGMLLTGFLAAHTDRSSAFFAETRFYAPVPFLFWAAIRFGMPGASGAVAIVAAFVVESAIAGHGPFSGQSQGDVALALQNFLFLRSAPLYVVAILVEQIHADQRSLKESEERFRRMAHSAPVLIWMAGPNAISEYVNQTWQDLTGRKLSELLGTGWTDVVHPEDLQWCMDRYNSAFAARQPFEMEYRIRRHDGEYRWVLAKGVPRLEPNGEFAGYVGSAIDITDMKRAEETNRALAHTQRLAVLGELTGSIAHELRQSLSAISLNAQAAEKLVNLPDPSPDEMREMVSDIRRSVVRADTVISRIREFLRKRSAQMQAIDVNTIVADVLLLAASDAARRGIRIETEFAEGLPPVLGDRAQLQQVLLNLVINGMDAENHLDKAQRRLALKTCLHEGRYAEITVTDSGCGIPEDQLPLLFDAFFSTRSDGMGLGLSIARTIVTAHRGRIWAENNDAGGATFHFTVPLAWPAAETRTLPLSA